MKNSFTPSNIGFANVGDIAGIIGVQDSKLLPRNIAKEGVEKLGDTGFIVHPITQDELEKALLDTNNHMVIVAHEKDEVVGYTLIYDLETWKNINPNWENDVQISIVESGSTLYLRHVASTSPGVGLKMERFLLSEAKKRGYQNIIGEILRKPIENKNSMKFHKLLGWKEIGEKKEDDNLWVVVKKSLTDNQSK